MTDPVFLRKTPAGRAETYVIVGGGQAASQAACTMRECGFRGRIVMVGEEPHPPYMRPPLSKKVLAGDYAQDRLFLRPREFYESSGIELRLGVRATGLDPVSGRIGLSDGGQLAYDKLLLATGARPKVLNVPGSRRPEVRHLRTLDDALRLRASMSGGVRLAIVGAGYVGLEVAATAATLGAQVVVLEIGERVLNRVTTPAISDFFAETHRSRGVAIHCGARVVGFDGGEHLDRVVCEDATFRADLVLVGIGAEPNAELAREAGLVCDDGIVVDEHCRTADPRIFAAGDCTRHPNPLLGRRVRLESVQNAVDQAAIAARNMCGQELRYSKAPWFWSHQFEFRLQSAGVLDQFDEVVERGDRASGSFALIYRHRGETVACDAVNMPGEYLAVRRELESRLDSRHVAKSGVPGRQAAA
jgi:3-phenylpropionate/trans-cinnamate dioxygenase ferredoxin reductase subunit